MNTHKLCAHGCAAQSLDDRCRALERRVRELHRENSRLRTQLEDNIRVVAREVIAEMQEDAK